MKNHISAAGKNLCGWCRLKIFINPLSEEQKQGALYFQENLKAIQRVAADAVFSDNEEPAFLPGIRIIAIPGRTPDHISTYVNDSKTLIAADALVYEDGELNIANPAYALHVQEAFMSIKRLQQLDVHTIVCYHGGIIKHDV